MSQTVIPTKPKKLFDNVITEASDSSESDEDESKRFAGFQGIIYLYFIS